MLLTEGRNRTASVIHNQEFAAPTGRSGNFSEPGEGDKTPLFSSFGSHRLLLTPIIFSFYYTGDSKCPGQASITDVSFHLSQRKNGSFRGNQSALLLTSGLLALRCRSNCRCRRLFFLISGCSSSQKGLSWTCPCCETMASDDGPISSPILSLPGRFLGF